MSFVQVHNSDRLRRLLQEIFTDHFMQENTNFISFEYFRYSSAVIANWDADIMVYNDDLLNRFVAESTRFSTFDEMVTAAADQYYKK